MKLKENKTMDNNTIERIKASINRQIDLHGQYVYKGLKEKNKHADGSYMYQYDQHVIDGLEIALRIIETYEEE